MDIRAQWLPERSRAHDATREYRPPERPFTSTAIFISSSPSMRMGTRVPSSSVSVMIVGERRRRRRCAEGQRPLASPPARRKPDRSVGAVAFRTGDPATGDFGDATVIRKFGVVPDDLSAL